MRDPYVPDDWSWRAFDEYNGRYDRDDDESLNDAVNEDIPEYWQERSELFAPPNVIHEREVE